MNTKQKLITCYVDQDIDGYAGVLAYAEYLNLVGQNAFPAIIGSLHDEVKYVIERFNITPLNSIQNDADFDEVALVDATDAAGLEGNSRRSYGCGQDTSFILLQKN